MGAGGGVEKVQKVGKTGVDNEMWMLLHQCLRLSFDSAAGQEIPVLPLQVRALAPKGFREGRWWGSVQK